MMVRMVTIGGDDRGRLGERRSTIVSWLPSTTLVTCCGVTSAMRPQDVEPGLDEVELPPAPNSPSRRCGSARMKLSAWKTTREGDGDHDADEHRDGGERDEQRGEHAVRAVALQPGDGRLERDRQDDADEHPQQDLRIWKRNASTPTMMITVSVAMAVAPAIRDDPQRRSLEPGCRPPRSSRSSDGSVTSPRGMTLSSGSVWIQSWRQLGPRRDERASGPDGMNATCRRGGWTAREVLPRSSLRPFRGPVADRARPARSSSPGPESHPSLWRNLSWVGVSTPSAMTRNPRWWARPTTLATIEQAPWSSGRAITNNRSIFRRCMGSCWRWDSDE